MNIRINIKKKDKERIIILVALVIIILNLITLPKQNFFYNSEVETHIAKAIVVLEKDELIEKKVDRMSFPIKYNFVIKNFDEKGNVNEVNLDYKIKIEASVSNFPVRYKIIDIENNKEIELNFGETPILSLRKCDKEIRKFELYVEWNDLEEAYADNFEIKLKIEAVQSKEEKESEEIFI